MESIIAYFKVPRLSYRVWKVWKRDKDVFMKTLKVNFLPPLLEPILYLAAFGVGLGIFVGKIDGVPYIQFMAPALVAISMMYSSFFECTYSSFVRMYYQKTFDAIIATPVSLDEVIAGEILWGATRSLINSSIVLGVIAVARLTPSPFFLLVPFFSFLAGLMFASIAMCFTAIVPSIDSFNYPAFLFITPMVLFCGTFFPITILPATLQLVAQLFLPLTHVTIIARNLTTGIFHFSMLLSFIWILAVTPVFFILSINLMKKRLIK
jgi:lipooligosaccharide transport system permease protein